MPRVASGGRPPVLLIPGLMAADWAMRPLAQLLHRRGYPTVPARIGFNVGCTTELVERLEARLATTRERHGRPAVVVGWSRGGTLGKIVTLRSPQLVAALITLGSPNVNPLAVSRTVMWQLGMLRRLNAYGLRRMLGDGYITGACADSVRSLLASPFPGHIPYIAFYSKQDSVVDWRACRDPDATLVEVRASHLQLGVDPRVLRHVVDRLDALQARAAARAS